MKGRQIILIFSFLVLVGVGLLSYRWKQDEPRRNCLRSLGNLAASLASSDSTALLQNLVLPRSLQGKTLPEQTEFVRKALQNEISPEGLTVLNQAGHFGPLTNLFPAEAEAWASQAGVKPEHCVAFRFDRSNGPRMEVVFLKSSTPDAQRSTGFRVLRVNNVKQLAEPKAAIATQRP